MKRSLRFIALALSCLSLNLIAPVAYAEGEPVFAAKLVKGDVNKDGSITSVDARMALRYSSSMEIPDEEQRKLSDMDGDGVLTTEDVRKIMSLALDLETYEQSLVRMGFPLSYVEKLMVLHDKYPEWEFVPLVTGLDWEKSVKEERNPHKQQLIENSVKASFMCSCPACDGVIQESTVWVSASEEAVKYYMDPRNFLNEEYIFQFESTNYDADQTKDGVEAILKGTWMHKADIKYFNALGEEKTYKEDSKAVQYSDKIMETAKNSGMSAYYLASKIVQEVGSSKASYAGGSSGKYAPFNGIYNYYNIGAYTGARDGLEWANGYMKAVRNATLYKSASATAQAVVTVPVNAELYYISAKDDFYRVHAIVGGATYSGYIKKADTSLYTSYGRPWTNPAKSIYYGAQYIYDSYSEYQYSGYLQKFNVNPDSDNLYNHEYMGNVRAAASEAKKTYNAYVGIGILETKKVFVIPVFENMPGADLTKETVFKAAKTVITVPEYTSSSVKLSWTAIENAEKYEVCKYNPDTQKYEQIHTTEKLTYTDKGLASGDFPKYKVRGYYKNKKGETVYSEYSSAFEATVTPKKPTDLKIASKGEKSVELKWKGVDCTGYVVYRYDAITGSYEKVDSTKSTVFKDTTVKSGTAYKYKIKAYIKTDDRNFYSAYSDEASVTTDGVAPKEVCPYAQPNVTLKQGNKGDSVKWLQWHLNRLGYLKASDIDGDFGATTLNAVKSFQTAQKLEADGIVGSGTRGALITEYNKL